MTGAGRPSPPTHVRIAHVEWVEQRLTERDWQIIEVVNSLRLVTTHQLDRLLFSDLSGRSQVVSRGRVIRRLIAWRVLVALPRRVGGAGHGSAATALVLDSTGRRLLALRSGGDESRLRYPGVPGERTVRHTLAVTELYTDLIDRCRASGDVVVSSFAAEPSSWWPNGLGGYLKPDAYLVLTSRTMHFHWWCEVDLATESLPTIRRKALVYLDFYQRGQLGRNGVMPLVLFSVPTERRCDAIMQIISGLPDPANALFRVTVDYEAAVTLLESIKA